MYIYICTRAFVRTHSHNKLTGRIRSTDAFAAFLTLTDLFGNQLGTPQPLPLEGVSDRDVKLLVEGPARGFRLSAFGFRLSAFASKSRELGGGKREMACLV